MATSRVLHLSINGGAHTLSLWVISELYEAPEEPELKYAGVRSDYLMLMQYVYWSVDTWLLN
jgi:hypothetical protein